MFRPSLSVLLASASLVSLVACQKVKIISPTPGSPVTPGSTLNLTLELDGDVCHQIALGFGLNSNPADVKSLGNVLLGTLDTTKTPFDRSTKQLSYPVEIPAADKLVNDVNGSYSLVVSQYYLQGAANTPDCNVVSVPVKIDASPAGPSSPKTGGQVPASRGAHLPKTSALQAEQGPPGSLDSPPTDKTAQQPWVGTPNPSGSSNSHGTTPGSTPSNGSWSDAIKPSDANNTTPDSIPPTGPMSDIKNPSGPSDTSSTTRGSPSGSTKKPCNNGTAASTNGTVPSSSPDDTPLFTNDTTPIDEPSSTNDTTPIDEPSSNNDTTPITDEPVPITSNGTVVSPLTKCTSSGSSSNSSAYPGANITMDSMSNSTSNSSSDMPDGCPPDVHSTGHQNSTKNGSIFENPPQPENGGSNSNDTSSAGSLGISATSVVLSFATVVGCMSTLA